MVSVPGVAFEGEFCISHIKQSFVVILFKHTVKLVERTLEFFDKGHFLRLHY